MNTPLIYIAGFGRSGSTLIEDFLQRNYDATGLGELFFIWERGAIRNERCSCGESFHDCPFWTEVLSDGFGRLERADYVEFNRLFQEARGEYPVPGTMNRAEQLARGRFGEISRTLYASIFKQLGSSVLIDSSKYPLFGASLKASGAGSPTPLHIYRDPRAVAASWQRVRRRPEANEEQQYMARSRSVLTSAMRWLWFNHTALQLRDMSDSSGLSLGYEEFCASPNAVIKKIAANFNLSARTSYDGVIGHSVSGNPSRFNGGFEKIRLDEGWKRELSTGQKIVLTALCETYYRRLLTA